MSKLLWLWKQMSSGFIHSVLPNVSTWELVSFWSSSSDRNSVMHMINILLTPLPHILYKLIVVMSSGILDRGVPIERLNFIHQREGHIFIVNIKNDTRSLLVNWFRQIIFFKFIKYWFYISTLVLVDQIKEVISEENAFIMNFSLSKCMESFI
jgi:hypothetical protein